MTKPLTVQKLIDQLVAIEDKDTTLVYHMCDGNYWPVFEEAISVVEDEGTFDGDLEPVPVGSVVLV